MAKEEVIERGIGIRDKLQIISLSRKEALEIICYLSAALANESLPSLFQYAGPNITVSYRGTTLYRLILGLEEKVEQEKAV